ncbi:hypothetical protein [Chryseobacterium sp. UNC8MFCol]|uniref:hypothetical protein n=1 Tax=Chryseobacterium sp. UNC8MFCol TaxID=1340435 RepID=UPI000483FEC2|nr:hypothetical protein [Chryseobacterium sp. UNC8MFCol]
MGLFDFLFKKKKKKDQTNEMTSTIDAPEEVTAVSTPENTDMTLEERVPPVNEDGNRFTLESIEAFRRFHSDPGLDFNTQGKDGNGNSIDVTYQTHRDLFNEWTGIQSKWDRISLLYHFWDQTQFEKLEPWQVIERFVKDRYPKKALQYFEKNMSDKRDFTVEELVSLSKLYRVLLDNVTAKEYIETAYQNHPENDSVKVEYATVLHIIGNHSEKELSHTLFHEVLDKKIERNDTDSVLDCFIFSEGYTDSSIFAMLYLMNTEADNDAWDQVSEEYYYCPVFRYEHAVQLSQTDNSLRALAKLTSLCQEFPWFKTALESTIGNIKSMRKQLNNPDFMEKELQEFQTSLQSL